MKGFPAHSLRICILNADTHYIYPTTRQEGAWGRGGIAPTHRSRH
jgi:hypothetical protein